MEHLTVSTCHIILFHFQIPSLQHHTTSVIHIMTQTVYIKFCPPLFIHFQIIKLMSLFCHFLSSSLSVWSIACNFVILHLCPASLQSSAPWFQSRSDRCKRRSFSWSFSGPPAKFARGTILRLQLHPSKYLSVTILKPVLSFDTTNKQELIQS